MCVCVWSVCFDRSTVVVDRTAFDLSCDTGGHKLNRQSRVHLTQDTFLSYSYGCGFFAVLPVDTSMRLFTGSAIGDDPRSG